MAMRILHVVGAMNRGGAETWLMHILRHVDRQEFRMDFLVHSTEPGAYDEEIRALGSRILVCRQAQRPWIYAPEFLRILRREGPYDVVHSQLNWFGGLIARLSSHAKVPVRIVHIHEYRDLSEPTPARRAYLGLMNRWILGHAQAVLVPSEVSATAFRRTRGDRSKPELRLVRNVVDLSQYESSIDRMEVRRRYGLPLDVPILIYVARLVAHKNHAQLFRIADSLAADGVPAHFVFVGSHGHLQSSLQEASRRRRNVTMLEQISVVAEVLQAADVFFFPSLSEGFGVVAIEAAAAGLPVVATDLPSVREACFPGCHRFLFPPDADGPARRHLVELLGDSSKRDVLGREGRDWVRQFTIEASLRALLETYESFRRAQPD